MIRRAYLRWLLASLLPCLLASGSSGGTVTGTIRNGTTGKPAAGVDVILIQLQGTMQPVANTTTDSQGHYHFDNPVLGTAPMLIRAVYRGVNYHEPVPPGTTTADVEVFEPTDKPNAFSVKARAIILQPSGSELVVGEEYNITNNTQPPMAYYRAGGSFVFSLPGGAQLDQVSAMGASGMAVTQSTMDLGKNQEAIDFPFRPGESGVRVSYKLPYAGDHASLRFVSPYAADRVAVFVPPSVQISTDGFSPAGQNQGFNVYLREGVAANVPMTVSISGTAPAPPEDGGTSGNSGSAGGADDSQNPSVNSRADSGEEAPAATATALPARLDSLKWILVAGFAALFLLGFAYLWRKPQAASAGALGAVQDNFEPPAARQTVSSATAAQESSPSRPSGGIVSADVERQVRGSLDDLKDTLFRLELRHQAGTISDVEYARERERIENLLRNLVRG
ncbi:MAG: hypothetical protein WA175_12185 [Candidatus Acidiferrales bacterium]